MPVDDEGWQSTPEIRTEDLKNILFLARKDIG
jgi:hypothetical protein